MPTTPTGPCDALPSAISPGFFSAVVDAVRRSAEPTTVEGQSVLMQPTVAEAHDIFRDSVLQNSAILEGDDTGKQMREMVLHIPVARRRIGEKSSTDYTDQTTSPPALDLAVAFGMLLKIGKYLTVAERQAYSVHVHAVTAKSIDPSTDPDTQQTT